MECPAHREGHVHHDYAKRLSSLLQNKGAFMFIPKVPFHAFSKRHKKEWLVRLIEWGSPYIVVLQLQYGGMDDLACE